MKTRRAGARCHRRCRRSSASSSSIRETP
jgi:hypothetical protein